MQRIQLSLFLLIIIYSLVVQSQPLIKSKSQPTVVVRESSTMSHDGRNAIPQTVVNRAFSGEAAGDNFGFSVATAGDVNGDAYPDIIVGAPMNDAAGTNAGRAYIFFGGPALNATPNVILTGLTAGDLFGFSVAGAGDMNTDGYDDVFVGAPGFSGDLAGRGQAYVFLGGFAMDNTWDEMMTGDNPGDSLGYSVAGVGDMNGDGYNDVIAGSPNFDNASEVDQGIAYIYFGADFLHNDPDVIIVGAESNLGFGFSVSGAGDVNSDGYSDVIVGTPFHDAGGTDAGRAYIYYGGAFVDKYFDVRITGNAGEGLGWSVAGAGDVNGDGYADVIVGKSPSSPGAFIYYGDKDTMDGLSDLTFSGDDGTDAFGSALATAGDVNGDGYRDILVGASASDSGGTDAGRVFVFYGGSTMNATNDVIFTGTSAGDAFGTSVSKAGDINGDGYDDLLIGAPGNDDNGANAGKVYLIVSNTISVASSNSTFYGYQGTIDNNQDYGSAVSGAGDFNNAGFDDFMISDPR
ncbi:MAG: FG-GAP repeat protein, partial [Ignavibacteriales bacterium]|nr:FG-GAP repeat protein [Ignavibacteriales bacterium]